MIQSKIHEYIDTHMDIGMYVYVSQVCTCTYTITTTTFGTRHIRIRIMVLWPAPTPHDCIALHPKRLHFLAAVAVRPSLGQVDGRTSQSPVRIRIRIRTYIGYKIPLLSFSASVITDLSPCSSLQVDALAVRVQEYTNDPTNGWGVKVRYVWLLYRVVVPKNRGAGRIIGFM